MVVYRITDPHVIPEMKKMSDEFDPLEHLVEIFSDHWNSPLLVEPNQERRWSYGESLKRAIAVDEWLQNNGYTDDEPIQFAPTNSSIPLTIYLGALLSDRRVYAIDPSRGKQDIDEMLDIASGEKLLTNDPSLVDNEKVVQLRPINPPDISKSEALAELSEANLSAPFLVTFTSGTTGTPKGVIHNAENLIRASIRFGERFDFSPEDTFYHTLPMGYMAGILNALLLPMCHGSKIVVGKRTRAATVAEYFDTAEATGVNVFWLTPTILKMLLQICSGPYDGPDSAIGCVATEPLPRHLQEEFEAEFNIKLYETYGLSETLFITSEFPSYSDRTGVGPGLPEVDLQIEEDGEIVVSVPWMFLGYENREVDVGQEYVYRTGDIGEIQNETLFITGRKKNLIVRNGINISPARIEDVLSTFNSVSDVVVFGQDSEEIGELVIAALEADDEVITKRTLQQQVTEELGSDHRPNDIVIVDELPRTNDGRVDYESIRSRVAEE